MEPRRVPGRPWPVKVLHRRDSATIGDRRRGHDGGDLVRDLVVLVHRVLHRVRANLRGRGGERRREGGGGVRIDAIDAGSVRIKPSGFRNNTRLGARVVRGVRRPARLRRRVRGEAVRVRGGEVRAGSAFASHLEAGDAAAAGDGGAAERFGRDDAPAHARGARRARVERGGADADGGSGGHGGHRDGEGRWEEGGRVGRMRRRFWRGGGGRRGAGGRGGSGDRRGARRVSGERKTRRRAFIGPSGEWISPRRSLPGRRCPRRPARGVCARRRATSGLEVARDVPRVLRRVPPPLPRRVPSLPRGRRGRRPALRGRPRRRVSARRRSPRGGDARRGGVVAGIPDPTPTPSTARRSRPPRRRTRRFGSSPGSPRRARSAGSATRARSRVATIPSPSSSSTTWSPRSC